MIKANCHLFGRKLTCKVGGGGRYTETNPFIPIFQFYIFVATQKN